MQLNAKKWLQKMIAHIFRRITVIDNRLRNEALMKLGLLEIGRHTYGNPIIHSYKGSEAKVKIGSFCSISPGVLFITGGIHPMDWVSLYPFRVRFDLPGKFTDGMPTTKGDIIVGNDVWIGTDVMIMSGVQIGDGAVIAARSVVTRDVLAYTLVGGIPAKTIRTRFLDEDIEHLLSIKWWNWDDEQIKKSIPFLSSTDIRSFINYAKKEEI